MQKLISFCLIGLIFFSGHIIKASGETTAEWGDTVTVFYILTVEGEEQESGDIPNIVLGKGHYLEEFEEAIVGLKEGETRSIDIPPEGGYPSGHKFGDVWMHFDLTLTSIDRKASEGDSSDNNLLIWTLVGSVLIILAVGTVFILFGDYFTSSSSAGQINVVRDEKRKSALKEIREIAEQQTQTQTKERKKLSRRR